MMASMKRIFLALFLAAALASSVLADRTPRSGALLARGAARQVGVTTLYDPSYVRLGYPNGDVPMERGVCADVVVRAFRTLGVDLQVEVHQDMKKAFSAYPRNWGLRSPDRNIDHRRVPNLMKYFDRKGKSLSREGAYEPGDIVAWRLPQGLYHIGMMAEERVPGTDRFFVIHNIGAGTRREDILHEFEIIGHYRW